MIRVYYSTSYKKLFYLLRNLLCNLLWIFWKIFSIDSKLE